MKKKIVHLPVYAPQMPICSVFNVKLDRHYTDEEEDSPPTCIRATNADLFSVDTVPKDKRD